MMHKFDKQVVDSISREEVKLTRTLLPDDEMKEIHFYKDGLIDSSYEWHLTHNSTMSAIESNNPCIYTTAISALDFDYLLDKGYRIFLHENGRVGEIHVGYTELTDRVIRRAHDIKRIWIGGGFQEYFYNEQNNLNNGTKN